MSEARWLSSEDALPEPGELAFVYVLEYMEQRVIFRTADALADAVKVDLTDMAIGDEAKITVETMTAERLGDLPEFDGW